MQLATVLLLAVMTSATAWATDVTLSGSNDYTANDGDVLTGETNGTVTIADYANITLNGATINGGIVCAGSAEITLVGTNSVTGRVDKAGIQVGGKGTTLIINGDGALMAIGGSCGAGIGLGQVNAPITGGNITINGGTVTAIGSDDAAGIGTGLTIGYGSASLGDITINGGEVRAGGNGGAGIGMGHNKEGGSAELGNITINGGTVWAAGDDRCAGIGTSNAVDTNVSLGNITINGGTVTARGGYEGVGVGTGYTKNSTVSLGNITIKGGTVTANSVYGNGGIGRAYYNYSNVTIGDVTIFTSVDMLYASSITVDVIYMNGEDNVTDNPTDYFIFTSGGSDCVIKGDYTAVDGDVLTGFTDGTVTIADGAKVTLNGVTINGGIVCKGDAEIILTGTNSVTGPEYEAGIQVGGEGTTLTIKGDGSLTTTGGYGGAGIGLGLAGNNTTITGGNIIIENGNITAKGGINAACIGTGCTANSSSAKLGNITFKGGTVTATGEALCAGIGTGYTVDSSSAKLGDITFWGGTVTATGGNYAAGIGTGFTANSSSAELGNITFKGGTVMATGGKNAAGIGTEIVEESTITIGAVKVYVGVDMLYASSISKDITYMNDEYDVTAMASDFFDITVDDGHYVIVTKQAVILADGTAFDGIYDHLVCSITYKKTLGSERIGKHQAWLVPFDYTITDDDLKAFSFYKINMIANAPNPSTDASDEMWVFLKKMKAGDVLHGNMPYVYKPLQAVTDYEFTTLNGTLKAKNTGVLATMQTMEDTYTVYGTYENTTATAQDPFYYVNINGDLSLGNDGAVTVGPYRWIIRKTSKFGETPSYVRAMHFFDGEDEMTGIGLTPDLSLSRKGEGEWYSIDGSKLDGKPTKSGIYLVGGRKVVIK